MGEVALLYFNIPDLGKFNSLNNSLYFAEIYIALVRFSISLPSIFLAKFFWSQYIFSRNLKSSYALKAAVAASTPSIIKQVKDNKTISDVFKVIYKDNRADYKISEIANSNCIKELITLVTELKKWGV